MVKQRLLAVATAILGLALVHFATNRPVGVFARDGRMEAVVWAVGWLLLATGMAVLTTSLTGARATRWMSLNWFLPALRRTPKESRHQEEIPWIRRVFPAVLFSDRTTKRRGLVRRVLRLLGTSWLYSPIRRLVQSACFVVFLVLFFWVCWPYDARPVDPGFTSRNWRFHEINQQEESIHFRNDSVPAWIKPNQLVYAVNDNTRGDSLDEPIVARVQSASGREAVLLPTAQLAEAQFDQLLTSAGPWSLHQRAPGQWPTHYADNLASKEIVPADLFLIIDPLVSLSTAIASRSWIWSLASAAVILIACVLIPRGFCGYVCPLGTLIDLFDFALGKRIQVFRVADDGWWVHIKYYLLVATLVCAVSGILVSGYVAAIPVITRGLLFLGEPVQSGVLRGWHLVPAWNIGHVLSIVLLAAVLGLGLLRPRFWCKYVCPSGAVFSLGNLLRISQRKVESSCIHCNKCVEVCPFDAIKPDFTTRVTDCTLCQTCGGVCPTHAIKFVERSNLVELKVANDLPTGETVIGRRGFMSLAAGSAAAVAGGVCMSTITRAFGADLSDPSAFRPVRPPGSVPEREFLQMCIRCGECFKACPNNVLQVEGMQQGLEGLWTPIVNADWAGCESSCNACGQVCPTGAIRALPMDEKKVARMGLAIVNEQTCLPFANREACQLCVDECNAAGYKAIEFTRVHTQMDDDGKPIEESGYLAPVVLGESCVGCGLCQTRCVAINVHEKGLLDESAIVIEAGPGKEDRIMSGSYIALRKAEAAERARASIQPTLLDLHDFIDSDGAARSESPGQDNNSDDPFGVGP